MASDDEAPPPDPRVRHSAYGAFSRGEDMTWDQLEVVAKDAGITGSQLRDLKMRDRALRLIQRYKLHLEVSGTSTEQSPDEEFRVNKGSTPAVGVVEFGSAFWDQHPTLANDDTFLAYLLFRAQAYYAYRSHYDAEHCTWIVREESEPLNNAFTILRAELNDSASSEESRVPPTDRDLEFRRSLEPSGDPVRTLKKLIDYALRCIAQKASDNAAVEKYRAEIGEPPAMVWQRVRSRERVLASDFGRARFAMSLGERMTFHKILKTPFRYAESKNQ